MKFPGFKKGTLALATLSVGALLLDAHFGQPRVLSASEVPIAFWAWRTRTPGKDDVQTALSATGANTVFLRAGQLELTGGSVSRIRPVSGTFPESVNLHLVYNGTPGFLRGLDNIDPVDIAAAIDEAFQTDVKRARRDGAHIVGIQLDLDVPTRLLGRSYTSILRSVRQRLETNLRLSITGLPTWGAAKDLSEVLDLVDFWIPQCYGSTIPDRVDKKIPISSADDIARTVTMARRLGKPFYAGLSVYGYVILYAKDGNLVELRGDIDPASVAGNPGLELVDRGGFTDKGRVSEIRYVFRAKSDVVLDGMIVGAGETLVIDQPTAASLSAGALAVRENAGDALLGICLFRIPSKGDGATLGIAEIATALRDDPVHASTKVAVERLPNGAFRLTARNDGAAESSLGDNAMSIELLLQSRSIGDISDTAGFTSIETLCRPMAGGSQEPCSKNRANVIRLGSRSWKVSSVASITFTLKDVPPPTIQALITMTIDDGRIERESINIGVPAPGSIYE